MIKINFLLLTLSLMLTQNIQAACMRILGDDVIPLELNDGGLVSGKREKVEIHYETVRVQSEKGGKWIETTRPVWKPVQTSIVIWNFGSSKLTDKAFGNGTIHMNNVNTVVVEHDPGDIVTQKVHPDGRVEELSRISGKGVFVYFPDGTEQKINLLSPIDTVYYLDDNGDVVLKSTESGQDIYYSQNVWDLKEITYKDFRLDGLEDQRKLHQSKLRSLEGKNLLPFAELNEKIDTYFYRIVNAPDEWVYEKGKRIQFGYRYDASGNLIKFPGWKIEEILLANDKGQYVVKAIYHRKTGNGESFMGRYIYDSHPGSILHYYYLYVDLTKDEF